MLEYLLTALVVFLPLAWGGFKWLRKIGMETKTVWSLLIAALLLVAFFPVLASRLHPAVFAGFNLAVFATAGWLIRTQGRLQEPAVCADTVQDTATDSGAATGADIDDTVIGSIGGVAGEAQTVGGTETSPVVELEESEAQHLTAAMKVEPEIAEPEAEDGGLSAIRDVAAAGEEVEHEAEVEILEAQPAVEAGAGDGSESAAAVSEERAQPMVEEEQVTQELVESSVLLDAQEPGQPEDETAGEAVQGLPESLETNPSEENGDISVAPALQVEEPLEALEEHVSGEPPPDVEDLIDRGFTAKFEGDFARAAANFFEAWRVAADPELFYLLGTELVTLFRELGDYEQALAILDIMAQNPAIDRKKAEMAVRDKRLLEITKRLLEEIGMPGIPASQIPRFIRHKAWLEFSSENLK